MNKHSENKSNEVIHVAFGIDENFICPMGVTITSIIQHNPELDMVFHVFASNISRDSLDRIKKLEDTYNKKIQVHEIGDSVLEPLYSALPPSHAHISLSTFTRLLIPNALKNICDKVLYLDADILCVGSMKDLLQLDFGESVAAVVLDGGEKTVRARVKKYGLQDDKYFNAGVLYMDIRRWLDEDITGKAFSCLLDKDKRIDLADQDALNIVLDGRVKYLEGKWNNQYRLVNYLRTGDMKMAYPKDTVFIHFIGWMKPWNGWNPHDSKNLYLKYMSLSPWSDCELNHKTPATYKEMHIYSLVQMRSGMVMNGMRWYGKYVMNKCLKKTG